MNSKDADIVDLVSDDTLALPESEHPVFEPVVTLSRKCFIFEQVNSEQTTSAASEKSASSTANNEQK